jgi:hypothetical protein
MKHARLSIIAIIFLFATAYTSAAQTPQPETAPRRVAISLSKADPISGILVGADANSLLVEVNGKLSKIDLGEVTMIIFAPARAKASMPSLDEAAPATVDTPESITAPAPSATTSTEAASPSTSAHTSTGGTVQVRGYYRKDGTYVRPHTRSAPRRRN